jgi:hypothetical protein
VHNVYQKSTFLHASGCNPFRWRGLSVLSHKAGLKWLAYWLRNFNGNVPLKVKNFRTVAVQFLKFSAGRRFSGAGASAYSRRSGLGRSPTGLITNLRCPRPGYRRTRRLQARVAPQTRAVGGGVWATSRCSNSASNFPAAQPSPLWPVFSDCRMPTRFSSRIRSSSRMDRPAACLSD